MTEDGWLAQRCRGTNLYYKRPVRPGRWRTADVPPRQRHALPCSVQMAPWPQERAAPAPMPAQLRSLTARRDRQPESVNFDVSLGLRVARTDAIVSLGPSGQRLRYISRPGRYGRSLSILPSRPPDADLRVYSLPLKSAVASPCITPQRDEHLSVRRRRVFPRGGRGGRLTSCGWVVDRLWRRVDSGA